MPFTRTRFNPELENTLLTALITSDKFIREVHAACNPDYFGSYGKVIVKWVLDYWERYNEAPNRNIESIFTVEKESLSPVISESISIYLAKLSDEYEAKDLNIPYLIDQAYAFFDKKSRELYFDKGRALTRAGRDKEAIALIDEFKGASRKITRISNSCERARKFFSNRNEHASDLFKLRGALGDLVGVFKRSWLVAILGPMKRGKSFWLQEMMMASIVNRKKTIYVNLEMAEDDVDERFLSRISGITSSTSNRVQMPIFDCTHNQCGTCPTKQNRVNDIALRGSDLDSRKPKWGTPGLGEYRTCSVCRDDPNLRKFYIPDVWYTWNKPKREFSEEYVVAMSDKFLNHYGNIFKQLTYSAYSATIKDIRHDINYLIKTDRFIPDVVIVDYADIVAAPFRSEQERSHINAVWQEMKNAAQEMSALWVTGSQTNRGALDKELVSQKDISEDIRKLAHVDIMLAINQTDEEKEQLMTRISCLAHRHRNNSTLRQVAVLQQLELGLPYLDSEFWDS